MTLTDDTFHDTVSTSDRPVLVDFWTPGCAQCRLLQPVLDSIAAEHSHRLVVATLDVAGNPETGSQYGITSAPTLLLFVDGEPKKRITGALPKQALTDELGLLT